MELQKFIYFSKDTTIYINTSMTLQLRGEKSRIKELVTTNDYRHISGEFLYFVTISKTNIEIYTNILKM